MYNPESLRNVVSQVRYFRESNMSYSSSISPQSSPPYLNWLRTDLEMLLQKVVASYTCIFLARFTQHVTLHLVSAHGCRCPGFWASCAGGR